MGSPHTLQQWEALPPSGEGALEQRARSLETEVATSRQLEAELRAKVEQLNRALEAERVERAHKEILFHVTDATSRAGSLEEIYNAALEALGVGLGVTRASVLLFDADGGIRFKGSRGLSEKYRAAVEGHSPWKPDEKNPSPVLVSDVREDPGLRGYLLVFEEERIGALAFFPLFSGGLLLGKFMLYYPGPHTFTEAETRLAQGIAHQVAFAVERGLAQQERERILGIVSHDLKNPLSAVSVAATTLLRQDIDPNTAKSVRRIASGASRMERLIAQLLQFAQARHGGGIAAADAEVAVEIHNGGPAIPPGLMPKLFDPYRRGGQPRIGPEGVGLGLFISREIVRAHGGNIDVKSDEAAGTTFTVRLPRVTV